MKIKKKSEEMGDKIGRERGKVGEDAQVKKKSKKQRIESETEDDGKKTNEEKRIDSEGDDGVKEKSKKHKEIKVDCEVENGVKKRNEDSENNNDSRKVAKKKRRKKQESGKSDKDVATPSSKKSTKKVKFSDQLEIFESEEEEEEVKLVRGKRYSKEEDELIKGSVLEYIENHALGDDGIKMIMECKSHPQIKGCWKEIASAVPWRTCDSVYNRAHTLFEQGSSRGLWTKEDLDLVMEFQNKHGNDWRTLADAMGKHRKHVKDAWRRIRLASKKKGHWMREEYQALFDLVNKDIRMKAFQEKCSKHGMLRDNIPWMAIS
ncbi:hypothetical protein V5N11_003477 [Cardamine amara subsp. amara]|uniref:Uncharacterized protein n=1 Tax=Cardamine amara subsp. amara TaxID=228776 RepID=A0ABD1C1X1_CARAN